MTALESAEPAERVRLLAPRLSDSILAVRIDAARALAGLEQQLPDSAKAAFGKALQEYIDVQMFNADRPESWTNLATVYAMRGDRARAADAFGRAIALDSSFVPAWVNLADFLRATRRRGRRWCGAARRPQAQPRQCIAALRAGPDAHPAAAATGCAGRAQDGSPAGTRRRAHRLRVRGGPARHRERGGGSEAARGGAQAASR